MRQTPLLFAWFFAWAAAAAFSARYVVPEQGPGAALVVGFALTAVLFVPAGATVALGVALYGALGELRFRLKLRRLLAASRPMR